MRGRPGRRRRRARRGGNLAHRADKVYVGPRECLRRAQLAALVRHYRALDKWENVVETYQRHLKVVTDASRKVELLLAMAKVGRPIPPALYAAVAEILAFIYRQRAALAMARREQPLRRTA